VVVLLVKVDVQGEHPVVTVKEPVPYIAATDSSILATLTFKRSERSNFFEAFFPRDFRDDFEDFEAFFAFFCVFF